MERQHAQGRVTLSSQKSASRRAIEQLIPRVRELIQRQATTETTGLPERTLKLAQRAQSEWLGVSNHNGAGRLVHSQQVFVTEAIALAALGLQKALSIMPYDCQIAAGIAMAHNQIVQMQTGEGKTYSGALVSYLLSLTGRGVHVCLPNAYLADRDQKLLQPAFDALGVRTAIRGEHDTVEATQAAYRADITYAAGHLFGFDYLRDQAEQRQELASEFETVPFED
jgi:preprotein translocase subunit SecA